MLEIGAIKHLAPSTPTSLAGTAAKLANSAKVQRLIGPAYRLPPRQSLTPMLIVEAAAFNDADAMPRSCELRGERKTGRARSDYAQIRLEPDAFRKVLAVFNHVGADREETATGLRGSGRPSPRFPHPPIQLSAGIASDSGRNL